MSSGPGNLFAEFLEDYFAETDEHLAAARQNLLTLDSPESAMAVQTAVSNLLRSFHSLKGLSAMVGVNEITQMSHLIEEYLRQAQTKGFTPDSQAMRVMMSAVSTMEEVIKARRGGTTAPDVSAILNSLRFGSAGARHVFPPGATPAAESSGSDWKFSFSPTSNLAEQGINVNAVRAQLSQLGTIISASPRVVDGGITFDFNVRSKLEASEIQNRIPAGVTWEAVAEREPQAAQPQLPTEVAAPVSSFVRVEMHKLDELMRLIGEMVIGKAHFEQTVRSLESQLSSGTFRTLQDINARLERQLRGMRDAVMNVRMVPIGQIFERMRFVVRGLERDTQKRVRLEIRGQQTQIDKLIVDRMSEPLLHMVRNAVSHGIVNEGIITLSARTHGEKVIIEVRDDGSGIDFRRLAEKARRTGIIAANRTVDASNALDVICSPGFSTREDADLASGRGVGMAVVRKTIQDLSGTLALETAVGQGSLFTITLPLTLVIMPALLVTIGEIRYAVPQSAVNEIISVETSDIRHLENNSVMAYRGRTLPILQVSDLLRVGAPVVAPTQTERKRRHVLVIGSDNRAMGLIVDKVTGQREVVVRSLSDPQLRIPGIIGATELGDGKPVLIVDAETLVRFDRRKRGHIA